MLFSQQWIDDLVDALTAVVVAEIENNETR